MLRRATLALLLVMAPALVHAQSRGTPSFQDLTLTGTLTAGGMKVLPESVAPVALSVSALTPDSTFIGRHFAVHASPAGRTKAFVGSAITVDAGGSGTNGPLTADYGHSITVIKRGFPAPTYKGEIDNLLIYGRQSGSQPTTEADASDMDGIQLNIGQVDDPGYAAGAEMRVSRTSSTSTPTPYAETHVVSLQMGVNDPWGKATEQGQARYGAVNRLTFGYGAIATTGALDRAFYALCSPSGAWGDYFMGGGGSAPDIRIKGCGSSTPGAIQLGPDGASITVRKDAGNNLIVVNSAGTQIFNLAQNGAVTMASATVQGLLTAGALQVQVSTPASATAPCTAGQISVDATYIYTCVSQNQWHRTSNGAAW